MRVLIDTTFARRGASGTAIYVEQLTAALGPLGVDVVAAANPRRGRPGGGTTSSLAHLAQDRWWETVGLPRAAREANADVVHHPLPAHARTSVPQAITVHDLAFERVPECFDPRFRAWASRAHKRAAKRADVVIAVSHTTARDIRARWGIPESRIVVAHHGPGQCGNERLDPPEGTPRHFLYVGDDEPRKDLATLKTAAKGFPLLIAGSAGQPTSPQELEDHLKHAIALVHPSLHEGFGLTPLEAMAAGTPVIAARSPGVTETCGDAVLYVPPKDPDALKQAMRRLTQDEGLRADLRDRGLRRAQAFSWATSARTHLGAYTLAAR